MARKRVPLTEAEWRAVFAARCRAKEGRASDEDRVLFVRAFEEDPERYAKLTPAVHEATKPFGSTR